MTKLETKDKDTPRAQVGENGGAARVGLGTGPEGPRLDSGFLTQRPWEPRQRCLCSTGRDPAGSRPKGMQGKGDPGQVSILVPAWLPQAPAAPCHGRITKFIHTTSQKPSCRPGWCTGMAWTSSRRTLRDAKTLRASVAR